VLKRPARHNAECPAKRCLITVRHFADGRSGLGDRSATLSTVKLVAQLHVMTLQRGESLTELMQSNFETVNALVQRWRFLKRL
jgi:hypothetical protein